MKNQNPKINLTIQDLKALENNLMLKLSNSERENLVEELQEIIYKFENYNQIDLSHVKPTNFSILSHQTLRKDQVQEVNNSEKIIKTSKNYQNKYICINHE